MVPLTTAEAAEQLGITPRGVLALIRQGRLKAAKRGRDWLCDKRSVAALARPGARHPGGRPRKRKADRAA